MKIGVWRVFLNIRLGFLSPYLIYVGFKHKKTFIINILYIEVTIEIHVLDWMIRVDDYVLDERIYATYIRNPKYEQEKLGCFSIPK